MTGIRAACSRVAAATVALGLAVLAVGSPPPASAAVPQPSLTVTGGGRHFTLQAGKPVHWTVGVTTRSVQLSSLVVRATATGPLVATGGSSLTLSLAGCTAPWDGQTCRAPVQPLIPATPLRDIDGAVHPLLADGTIPAEASLLATVELDPAASPPGGGQSAVITLMVSAAGITPSAGPEPPTGNGEGPLATTGTGITVSALLGAVAVVAGIVLSGLARRSRAKATP
jgi:hypothetical protein